MNYSKIYAFALGVALSHGAIAESINVGPAILDLQARVQALENAVGSTLEGPTIVGGTYAIHMTGLFYYYDWWSDPLIMEGTITFNADGSATMKGTYRDYWWDDDASDVSFIREEETFDTTTDDNLSASYVVEGNTVTITLSDFLDEDTTIFELTIGKDANLLVGGELYEDDENENGYPETLQQEIYIYHRID